LNLPFHNSYFIIHNLPRAPIDQPSPRPRLSPWSLLILACLIAFAITAGIAVWITHRVTGPALSASITQEFREYVPTVGPTDGILETATSSIPETFTQTDSAWLFNIIPLGTTVSEIRVPAIYRYHIQLFDPWKLVVSGQVCLVFAPQFQPSLPPAILTAQMEKSTTNGWLRFDSDDDLTNLERGITGELDKRANDKLHRDFVREACRQSVAAFVKSWFLKEDYWRQDRFHQIVVVFPDEVTPSLAPGDGHPPPSVTFETQSKPSQ
jgi:hypothetical protein